MAKFAYIISDKSGIRSEGVVEANTKDIASKKLREQYPDKIIIALDEKTEGKLWIFGKPSLSFQDKMMFTKHLSTMIKVGITVTESLEILASQAKRQAVKDMYEDMIDMISSGQTLANALKKYNNIFSEIFVNMIETGEASGNLEKTLEYLDIQLEKEYEIRKKVITAFVYPAVIISLTLTMAIGIVIFIMPKIIKVFESFDMVLPLPTRILIGFSNLLTQKTLLSLGILELTITFFTVIFRLKALKPFWHKITIYLPVFGGIIIASNLARIARTLNSLLQSGVPIIDTLEITGNMISNTQYKRAVYAASEKVEQGGKLGDSFEDYKRIFPDLATKMFYIGERTGSLETTTEKLAQLYEAAVDSKTKNLSVLLEPLLLVFMGVLVGGIALAIIFPIYQLPNLISK